MTTKELNQAIKILKENGFEVVCFPFTKHKVLDKAIEVNEVWIGESGVLKASWGSLDQQGVHANPTPKNIES